MIGGAYLVIMELCCIYNSNVILIQGLAGRLEAIGYLMSDRKPSRSFVYTVKLQHFEQDKLVCIPPPTTTILYLSGEVLAHLTRVEAARGREISFREAKIPAIRYESVGRQIELRAILFTAHWRIKRRKKTVQVSRIGSRDQSKRDAVSRGTGRID